MRTMFATAMVLFLLGSFSLPLARPDIEADAVVQPAIKVMVDGRMLELDARSSSKGLWNFAHGTSWRRVTARRSSGPGKDQSPAGGCEIFIVSECKDTQYRSWL